MGCDDQKPTDLLITRNTLDCSEHKSAMLGNAPDLSFHYAERNTALVQAGSAEQGIV